MNDFFSSLSYAPVELRFGTSGRRGRVADLTQLEIYINVLAELTWVQRAHGVCRGDEVYFAYDLRPSSRSLCLAAEQAIRDAGMRPVNLGAIPTPALTCHALSKQRASVMITGSHIPFDLNGYKFNTPTGEILKEDEAPITEQVRLTREVVYRTPAATSLFDAQGMFRERSREPSPAIDDARDGYLRRYLDFFGSPLRGKRVLVYQHSAVGRDLLAEVLAQLGADVVTRGRSDTFVAIDTEAIGAAELATVQSFVDDDSLFAVASTDGDSDRPLILGVEHGKVRFFSGDLVGMVVAGFLGADAVVVPVTCNDAIDRSALAAVLEPKTKIGSPHVIAGMNAARAKGRRAICGWEANGGFLLGSDISRGGKTLTALPTRDAFLPIVATLTAAAERNISVCGLFDELPPRFSRAALLREFPRETGRRIVSDPRILNHLDSFFGAEISRVDLTDGPRIYFANGDVAHFRPSGNADEFRMYAVADTAERAEQIVREGLAEPDGVIRRMERSL